MTADSGDALDLTHYLRAGDRVVWGQACAEPTTLTDLLRTQRHRLPGVTCFIGIPARDLFEPDEIAPLRLESYCGTGSNKHLHAAGRLDIVPVHYSTLPDLLSTGRLHADVVLVQVSPPDEHGRHSLGLGDDYFSAALDSARVVIAEINDHVPFTHGARTLSAREWTVAVRSCRVPAEIPVPEMSQTVCAVAREVARVVPDAATLQFGIGALPEACLAALADHNDLGIHSGLINDTAMRLITSGVATGRYKTLDQGVAVGGLLGGSTELFRFAHHNPAIELRGTRYTHDHGVLSAQHRMVAINAAIEVDVSGQVNAEAVGGRYVGAIGGAVDFLRGAAGSEGGVPIVALPSTAGAASRIVTRLSGPVSTARSDVGVIVTEFGAADLRGRSIAERRELMVAIAHPDHREALVAGLEETVQIGSPA